MDKSAKVYDVVNFDMIAMFRLSFVPQSAAWIFQENAAKAKLAISEKDSPNIHIFDARSGNNDAIQIIQVSGDSTISRFLMIGFISSVEPLFP